MTRSSARAAPGCCAGRHARPPPRPAWRTAQRKHEEMYEAYLAQDFDKAIELCNLLHGHFDGKMSGYYDMWIERCEFQKTQDLPKDWNGVFIATSK